MTRVTGVLVALTVLLGSGTALGPAASAAPRAGVPHLEAPRPAPVPTARQGRATYRAVLVFAKNHRDQSDSRLTYRLLEKRGPRERVALQRSWRAGSGMPRTGGMDPCVRNTGWPPNGRYRLTLHRDYAGQLIRGRTFRMDDKACQDGTVREALFIHTEQGAGNRQCPDEPGDQTCRWEGPKVNDYTSKGCLKLAPGDLRELARLFERRFDAGTTYAHDRVTLRVVG